MSDQQKKAAPAQPADLKAESRPAMPAAARPAAAGDLDLEVEEIERPKLMKEGFVGQER